MITQGKFRNKLIKKITDEMSNYDIDEAITDKNYFNLQGWTRINCNFSQWIEVLEEHLELDKKHHNHSR